MIENYTYCIRCHIPRTHLGQFLRNCAYHPAVGEDSRPHCAYDAIETMPLVRFINGLLRQPIIYPSFEESVWHDDLSRSNIFSLHVIFKSQCPNIQLLPNIDGTEIQRVKLTHQKTFVKLQHRLNRKPRIDKYPSLRGC